MRGGRLEVLSVAKLSVHGCGCAQEFNEVMDQVEMKKVCKNAVALHKRHCLQAAGRAGAKGAT